MRADALSQAMVKKRWTVWAMIYGTHSRDSQFAEAIRKSAKKFKIRLRSIEWDQDADIRRSASSELPIFTQIKDHGSTFLDIRIQHVATTPHRGQSWPTSACVGSYGGTMGCRHCKVAITTCIKET